MKLHLLFGSLALAISNSVMALPSLSQPSDIFNVGMWNSIVEITNAGNNSILQCQLVEARLQNCQSITIDGLTAPFLAGVAYSPSDGTPTVYVTQKGTANLFGYKANYTGTLKPNTSAVAVPLPPYIAGLGNILDMDTSNVYDEYNNKPEQKFYISVGAKDKGSNYGKVVELFLDSTKPEEVRSHWLDLNLPFFTIAPSGNVAFDQLVGAGQLGGSLTSSGSFYPFSGSVREDNGELIEQSVQGGTASSVPFTLPSSANSIFELGGAYWVSYNKTKKWSAFDWEEYPNQKPWNESDYDAPLDANIRARGLHASMGAGSYAYLGTYITFADENKVGVCRFTGRNNMSCHDAFRYIDTVFSLNDSNAIPKSEFSSKSLNDHGSVIFRNINYSPLNADEIHRDITIPTSLKAAFSGTCLDKVDFSAKEAEASTGNDTCTLNFDFSKLTNIEPISESFDVSFNVIGPFGKVPSTFHFNVDLPTSIPHFQFEQNGDSLSELNLIAGDSGSIDVTYLSDTDDSKVPQFTFLNNGQNSEFLRSYFTDTGCLSATAPQLSSGEHCSLSYRIPAAANNNSGYSVKLDNPSDIPDVLSTLSVHVESSVNIIAHSPYDNKHNATLNRLHQLNLQSGDKTTIRFTNLGAVLAENFNVKFTQPSVPIPLSLSGSCTTHPDLEPLDGSCDLTLELASTADVNGKYELQLSADDYTGYDIPVTLGEYPFDKGIGVSNGNTNLQGTLNISQLSRGYIKVTNYTGYPLNDLTITLPELNLTYYSTKTNSSIFYEDKGGVLPSCIKGDGAAGDYHISLDQLGSCEIAYTLGQDIVAENPDADIKFSYPNEANIQTMTETQKLHLTNKNALILNLSPPDDDMQNIKLDASHPVLPVILTNHSGYTVKNLTFGMDDKLSSILNIKDCQGRTLKADETCKLTFILSDSSPSFGQYKLSFFADNLGQRIVPISITLAPMNRVAVENRGGYSMFVDYTGFYPNKAGNDPHCRSGSCYANAQSGWFTNPFGTSIVALPGRKLQLNMVAGLSVIMPSCDGGKIECTGTTLNPSCKYISDGSNDTNSPQNQCLVYNKSVN
ncbi:hypothetical protein D5018_08760 [Parashewanella curva]|uniref:Uncharacterized protein n=1 Tax=Parashewanella curva TaxID=2338552 RepID=A0A3L8PZ89_9GAMM|nr:hypothetical protein [Parashewanella curva]RLV60099.1 hypothetical protein D5018_08760 [Parashewanella curva]